MATEVQVLKNGPRRIESDFAPFVDGGISPWFEVFPLNLPTGDPIVTGINDVETNRGDAIIRYIDAMGHCSVQPFKGFNIVVIQQGGQRRVQKVIKQ